MVLKLTMILFLFGHIFALSELPNNYKSDQIIVLNWESFNLIDNETQKSNAFISSAYFDPISHINHLLYSDNNNAPYYWHAAVSNEGKILHSTYFNDSSSAFAGSIQGPKDGKHLYLAFSVYSNGFKKINFTESDDNGTTWSLHQEIGGNEKAKHAIFQDMIYVNETGRLFIFYIEDESKYIHIITKPLGSAVFSDPMKINMCYGNSSFKLARATYNIKDGRHILHLFYQSNNLLYYTRSGNNGITWTSPRVIETNKEIRMIFQSAADMTGSNNFIAVSYASWSSSDPVKLVYSRDYGETFSNEIDLTNGRVYYSDNAGHRMQIFGTEANPMMGALFATGNRTAEFSVWFLKGNFRKILLDHPFDTGVVRSGGIDFLSLNDNEFNITAFVTDIYKKNNQLWFSHGSAYIR